MVQGHNPPEAVNVLVGGESQERVLRVAKGRIQMRHLRLQVQRLRKKKTNTGRELLCALFPYSLHYLYT